MSSWRQGSDQKRISQTAGITDTGYERRRSARAHKILRLKTKDSMHKRPRDPEAKIADPAVGDSRRELDQRERGLLPIRCPANRAPVKCCRSTQLGRLAACGQFLITLRRTKTGGCATAPQSRATLPTNRGGHHGEPDTDNACGEPAA